MEVLWNTGPEWSTAWNMPTFKICNIIIGNKLWCGNRSIVVLHSKREHYYRLSLASSLEICPTKLDFATKVGWKCVSDHIVRLNFGIHNYILWLPTILHSCKANKSFINLSILLISIPILILM